MSGTETVFSIIILVFSVVLHEISHGYMALYLGDPTAKLSGRLTLNPFSHLDPFGSVIVPIITSMFGFTFGWAKPVPYNPYNLRNGKWGPALVAAAGPGANLIIALVFGLSLRFGFLSLATPFGELAFLITIVNIVLAVFNMVPLPPLDGSKVLFALIPYKWRHIEEILTRSQFIIIALIILFGAPFVSYFVQLLATLIIGPIV